MLQKLFATTLFSFVSTASTALADTRAFVTNLTGEPIAMNAITPTGGLKASAWRPGASWVGPGARTEVLRFNRADGVFSYPPR